MIYFNAYDNTVQLKWATASETNNRGFEVLRSQDGTDWEVLGFVDGLGAVATLSSERW